MGEFWNEYGPLIVGILIGAAPLLIPAVRKFVKGTSNTVDDAAFEMLVDFAEKKANADLDGDGDIAGKQAAAEVKIAIARAKAK